MLQTSLNRQAQQVADSINNEFFRLGIGTDTDPISGLMARVSNLTEEILVEVYDDYDSGIYQGQKLLEFLQGLTSDVVSIDTIWQLISFLEV